MNATLPAHDVRDAMEKLLPRLQGQQTKAARRLVNLVATLDEQAAAKALIEHFASTMTGIRDSGSGWVTGSVRKDGSHGSFRHR